MHTTQEQDQYGNEDKLDVYTEKHYNIATHNYLTMFNENTITNNQSNQPEPATRRYAAPGRNPPISTPLIENTPLY